MLNFHLNAKDETIRSVMDQVQKLKEVDPPLGPTVGVLSWLLHSALLALHSLRQVRQKLSVEQQFLPQRRSTCFPQPRMMDRTFKASKEYNHSICVGLQSSVAVTFKNSNKYSGKVI